MGVDPRLRAAMREQLARRREVLEAGAEHVGWKLGVGDRERIAGSLAVGYLTSATTCDPGDTYAIGRFAGDLRADVELAVRVGQGLDIESYALALEIVDLAPALTTPDAVVASNVFHRAVALGAPRVSAPTHLVATVQVDGRPVARGEAKSAVAVRIREAAEILGSVGEHMRKGDWVITGSIVQVPVAAGNEVVGSIDGLGAVSVRIAP